MKTEPKHFHCISVYKVTFENFPFIEAKYAKLYSLSSFKRINIVEKICVCLLCLFEIQIYTIYQTGGELATLNDRN